MQSIRALTRTTSRIARSLPVVSRVLGSQYSLPLEGRVVFVTGAARGLGAEIARQAHAHGAYVALVGRRLEPLQELAGALGDRAAAFEADVTDVDKLQRAAEETVATFGGIDVVVANAGIAPPDQTVAGISPDDFERTVEVDLLGQWRTARATLPALIERQGHILFVGSIYAFFNGVLAASYAVSKAGVEQLARALRVELAPHGVTVGIAYLGFIDTDLAADVFSQQHAAQVRQAVPSFLTRPITVADAAEAVLDGVQRRAARVTAPAWVGPMLATRGITTRLMDSILLHNADVAAAITGAETDSDGST
ncbi:short-chain dehydrogenase/reductase [Mycobacterium bourgelatii]|uniref:Oxidoreductase n=1 Tax=Mycobacterium bourgelatii TaxID=1273442 RepID=A0A7I9YRJ5_MYCBU|nr:short-chain dehydrogenase/reductase [Mycobacterium bourgelatii]MCV6974234.1 SDR family NAD(P)-dependent oxidoreductase [Mycobacterium bourgelatii]GFG91309.1 oxidoreductase [Mycobacterium bourgelatii]